MTLRVHRSSFYLPSRERTVRRRQTDVPYNTDWRGVCCCGLSFNVEWATTDHSYQRRKNRHYNTATSIRTRIVVILWESSL
jgi:hypothetical protein